MVFYGYWLSSLQKRRAISVKVNNNNIRIMTYLALCRHLPVIVYLLWVVDN